MAWILRLSTERKRASRARGRFGKIKGLMEANMEGEDKWSEWDGVMLSRDGRERVVESALMLAATGNAGELVRILKQKPWVALMGLNTRSGEPHRSVLSYMCNYAGAKNCFDLGASVEVNWESKGTDAYVEEWIKRAGVWMVGRGERMAGIALIAFFMGLDENEKLPKGFGSRKWADILAMSGRGVATGILDEKMARWWLGACELAGSHEGGRLDEPGIKGLIGAVAGETLALLVEVTRESSMGEKRSMEFGASVGKSLAVLTEGWPNEELSEAWISAKCALFDSAGATWKASLANAAYAKQGDGSARWALEAVLGCLGEPFLKTLSVKSDGSFAVAIEARRVELAAVATSAKAKSLRM